MNEKEKWLAGEDLENENLSPDEEVIHEQNKTIARLQEQLNEANDVLKDSAHWATDETENQKKAREYLKKWGVK